MHFILSDFALVNFFLFDVNFVEYRNKIPATNWVYSYYLFPSLFFLSVHINSAMKVAKNSGNMFSSTT